MGWWSLFGEDVASVFIASWMEIHPQANPILQREKFGWIYSLLCWSLMAHQDRWEDSIVKLGRDNYEVSIFWQSGWIDRIPRSWFNPYISGSTWRTRNGVQYRFCRYAGSGWEFWMPKRRLEMLAVQNIGPIVLSMYHPDPPDPPEQQEAAGTMVGKKRRTILQPLTENGILPLDCVLGSSSNSMTSSFARWLQGAMQFLLLNGE